MSHRRDEYVPFNIIQLDLNIPQLHRLHLPIDTDDKTRTNYFFGAPIRTSKSHRRDKYVPFQFIQLLREAFNFSFKTVKHCYNQHAKIYFHMNLWQCH